MGEISVPHRKAKAVFGAVILAALVALALVVSLPKPRPAVSKEILERHIASLPGFAGILSLRLDGIEYNGQEAARIVAADVLIRPGAPNEVISLSMKSAGDFVRERINIYQKFVITGYRRQVDFDEGLAFRSRAVWLAPELAAPLDGWSVIRLPDKVRPFDHALDGIYSNPTVTSAKEGALVVTVDLDTERRFRPAADVNEILAAPLVDCVDYDNAFERSPALKSLDVTILSSAGKVARFAMTRDAYEATDVSRLLAGLSKSVLKVSAKEFAIAERYGSGELYSPLVFDKVVKPEDKDEIRALEAERREAETEFYKGLFSKGVWETQ